MDELIERTHSFQAEESLSTVKGYGNCLYCSTVTSTTLGCNDMRLAGNINKVLSMLGAFLGAFTIPIFAVLYLRRLVG